MSKIFYEATSYTWQEENEEQEIMRWDYIGHIDHDLINFMVNFSNSCNLPEKDKDKGDKN